MSAGHAVLAPSSAHQWKYCPGSVLLQLKHARQGDMSAAIEGTTAHTCAASWLDTGEPPDDMPTDMRDAIAVYVADVLSVAGVRRIETRVSAALIHPQCWGTSDAIVRRGHDLYVWDYKHGRMSVDVWMNWQLIAYACGVAEAGDTIHLRIVQPRSYHPAGARRQWVIRYDQLVAFAGELREAALLALGDDPPLTPGRHCRYCTARHVCPAARRMTLDAVDYITDAVEEILPDAALGDEIQTLRSAAELISARLNGLESDATTRLASGRSLSGLEVRFGSGRLEWDQPAGEVLRMGELLGVDLAVPVSPRAAIRAGLPDSVVAQYCQRKAGSARVHTDSNDKAKRIFACPQK